jgi:transcriptional regulator with XRE-family HTH domain
MKHSQTEASRGLKAWRDAKGLTQMQAAMAIGIAQTRYSEFECGARKPGRTNAVTIERGTGGAVRVEDWDEPAAVQKIRKAS